MHSVEVPHPAQAKAARALDFFNICMADVRDGVGPYLALYLVAKADWNPARIGWSLAAATFATLLGTMPAGWLFDVSRDKRGLLIIASLIVAACTAIMVTVSDFWPIIILQFCSGLAMALIGPGIAAISLGLVGPSRLATRIGRNEAFNHSGNFVAALVGGALARQYSVTWVFALVVAMALLSTFAILAIRARDINNRMARGLHDGTSTPIAFGELLRNKKLLGFLLIIFAFQLANASMLPIAVQVAAANQEHVQGGVFFLSYGIVVAQLTAIPVAWLSGMLSRRLAPKICVIIGLSAVALRALVFGLTSSMPLWLAAQALDGVAGGVLAVAPLLVIAQLTHGSGRFTLVAGSLASAIGLGAATSNVAGGYLLQSCGAFPYFMTMLTVALFTLVMTFLSPLKNLYSSNTAANLTQPKLSV